MIAASLIERHELLASAGTLAAHANAAGGTFRQRDVRFLIELFSNWVNHAIGTEVLPLQNTQILRYLEQLATAGYARRSSAAKRPQYRLTRPGLLEVTARLAAPNQIIPPEQFYFLVYFISSYSQKITDLVRSEGPHFPLAMKLELDSLLDLKQILRSQIRFVGEEIQKLDSRIRDGEAAAALSTKRFKEGRGLMEIVAESGRLYPYGLNSQKPLTVFFAEITPDMRRWELETGNAKRAELIWRPARSLLQLHLKELRKVLDLLP